MEKLKILIVEDELIIAEDLKDTLTHLGYNVCGIAINAQEARALLNEHAPHLTILDVQIKGAVDGIELAHEIRDQFKLPYIFLTSHADANTLQRAKDTHPYGYLVKPFQEKDIHAAVEIAVNNFSLEREKENQKSGDTGFFLSDSLFVRNGSLLVKVKFTDILYLEADANYTNVYTKDTRYVIRAILKQLEQKLDDKGFVRIHKSYLINLNAIEAIDSNAVHIGDKEIPISRSQHSWLLNQIEML